MIIKPFLLFLFVINIFQKIDNLYRTETFKITLCLIGKSDEVCLPPPHISYKTILILTAFSIFSNMIRKTALTSETESSINYLYVCTCAHESISWFKKNFIIHNAALIYWIEREQTVSLNCSVHLSHQERVCHTIRDSFYFNGIYYIVLMEEYLNTNLLILQNLVSLPWQIALI